MVKTILIADDEPDYLNLTRETLEEAGYRVLTAVNGLEAVQKLREESAELIILDISMPGMNGYEACAEIRKDPLYRTIPVIMLTVLKEKKDKLKGLKLGSDEYITKPFRPRELLLRIERLIGPSGPK